jgi:hypothetical protein
MMIGEVSTIEEELALAQADARDMKRTVIALRTELEAAHAEIHDSTLRATQASAAEIAQLKTTVGALREELERARVERDKAIQQERVAASQESQMLKATAAALREELERSRAERDKAVQQERVVNHNEMQQLKATSAALREELERARADTDNAVRTALVSAQGEIAQLRQTVSGLRESLELAQIDKANSVSRERTPVRRRRRPAAADHPGPARPDRSHAAEHDMNAIDPPVEPATTKKKTPNATRKAGAGCATSSCCSKSRAAWRATARSTRCCRRWWK